MNDHHQQRGARSPSGIFGGRRWISEEGTTHQMAGWEPKDIIYTKEPQDDSTAAACVLSMRMVEVVMH